MHSNEMYSIRHSRIGKKLALKSGVSLVTVLLFMLVATIAATATYKWLTSEGRSSASRMMKREAYQSAVAGIENARAWMTFHANETGALIAQYIYDANDKPKTTKIPINMDDRIRSFAQGSSQDHHVWLVGVNTEKSTYKVKILSEGRSRNGQARHTEVAIFNVDGLYQVNKPKKEEEVEPIPFEYAYFGGSYDAAGTVTISSAVVNGNWKGNPQNVTGNFIVTGDVDLSGNDNSVGPLACIGGNARLQNKGLSGTDLYIDGNAPDLRATLKGDAFFGGNVKQPNTGAIKIDGNVTINGKFKANLATQDYYVSIGGNLCTGENGVVFSSGTGGDFTVAGDVWMPGDINLWYGNVDGSDCQCYKYEYKCTYKKCTCPPGWWYSGGDCREDDYHNPSCTIAEYDGPCGAADNGQWITKEGEKVGTYSPYAFYKLSSQSERVEGTVPCAYNENSLEVVSCANYELFLDDPPTDDIKNNVSSVRFILGGEGSSVHIKSAYSSQDYVDRLRSKSFVQTKDADNPRSCKEGPTTAPFNCTEYDNGWDDASHQPYKQSVTPANDLYYIYNMPEGREDVGFGTYWDDKWSKNFYGYFIDFASQEKTYSFTTSTKQTICPDANRPVKDGEKCYRYLNHTNNRITGSPYCKLNKTDTPPKQWQPICGVNPWFKSSGSVSRSMSGTKPICGETVQTKCKAIWGDPNPSKGCDGAKYFVKDPIVTAKATFEAYATKGCAADITKYGEEKKIDGVVDDPKGYFVYKLNKCYEENINDETLRKENLYNDFLVVKVSGGSTSTNPSGKLKGKFIIIAEDPLYTSFMDTEDDAYVFYYLEAGVNTFAPATRKNTFIYSEGHMGSGNQFNLTGTIYATAESCADMEKLQSSSLTYDPELVKVLNKAKIICENKDGVVCGGTTGGTGPGGGTGSGSGGGSEESSSFASGDKDPHFISNAPQLGVTLESQYESSETIPAGNGSSDELAKSFIVLPRIIYLNRDPVGKLSDYFNVIPLNGANVTKSTANVSCSPSLNVNSNLVSDGSKLTEGIYECKAAPNGLKKVDFWVWVQGSQQSSPPIYFVEQSKNLSPNENHEVKIDLPPHATEIMVKVDCPDAPTGWPNYTIASNGTRNGDVCTFTFPADASNHDQPTLFTVSAPSEPTNGTLVFSLQQPEPNAGYKLGSPTTTSLIMASTATLNNTQDVSLTEINIWCATHSGCPAQNMRSSWPDCPYKTTKEWVAPDWTPGSVPNLPNISWSIVSGTSGTLKLKEKESSGCIVIIPEENNSRPAPIEADSVYTLRAIAKAKSHKVTLQFVGTVADYLNPFVSVKAGERDSIPCNYNDKDDHSCVVSVFDGENVKIGIDDEDTQNKGFSYWKCDNNGGSTCPSTDPISSKDFSDEGFTVKDDNAIVYIHFGERDKHCFFDEFRRGNISCGTETEYCIDFCSGTCANATSVGDYPDSKWNLIAGSASNIETSSYPGYVVAAKNTPNTGVKVMSTVQAGVRGTLRTLFQVPHATASYGRETSKIKNSGFMLRADASGSEYLMLNVYENASGYLEAQLCLVDGGSTGQCRHTEFIRNGSRAGVTPSSMVMLVADLRNQNVLQLKAFTGRYYYNSSDISETAYTAEFNDLSDLGNNHANMTFQYVGFSLAHRDFKIYGIGWESEDYGSECFDGPPTVKCSFAAVAQNGIIPTNGSGEGQSTAFQKPWVGHSGWFDSQDCTPSFTYVTTETSDANVDQTEGYKFDQSGAGAHGFKDAKENDVKTAKASLSCSPTSEEARAWASTVELAHCGPFWTGKYTECKNDVADLLAGTPLYIAGSIPEGRSFDSKNLRGLEKLEFTISNETESEVDLEVWLESQSDSWGSSRYSSRHERITGNTNTITREFDVVSAFGDNATGFDPENVVGVMFRNNGGSSVTVNQIAAPCRNTVKFDGCSVERDGETGWKVTIDVSKNPDKLSKIYLKETGAGITIPNSGEFDYEGNLTLSVSDASIYSNAGKTYAFSAKVYSETNAYTSPDWVSCECTECTIGAITCKNASVTAPEIEVGKPSPQFHFELSGCPPKGCAYEVKLNETKLNECTNAQAASTEGCPVKGEHNVTAPKQTPTDLPATYTYSVVNPSGSATTITNLDKCTKTFKIVEKAPDRVTCSFTSVTSSASGSDLGEDIVISNPSVSCEGGGCKYSVKEGSTTIKAYTDYSDGYGFSFEGSKEAGTHTYNVYMQRGSEQEVECTGSYTVTYPLNLSCGTFTNPGATTPIEIGASVTPASPVVPSSELSGCNDKCSYAVTGGGSVSGGSGTNSNGTAVSSFSDASASGIGSSFTVNYTLTVSLKDGVAPLTCTLPVTYTSGVTSCNDRISWAPNSGQNPDNTGGGSWTGIPQKAECFDIDMSGYLCTGSFQLKMVDCKGETINWNGASVTLLSDNDQTTGTIPAPGVPIRISAPKECTISQLYFTGCSRVSAATAAPSIICPTSSQTSPITKGTGANTNISVSNCAVVGGCSYTITKGGSTIVGPLTTYGNRITIPGDDAPGGPYTYVLSVSNSQSGGTPSTCTVYAQYETVTVATLEAGDTESITCGNNVKTNISCSNTCSKLQCSGPFDSIKMKRKSNNETQQGNRYYMAPFTVNGNGGPSTLIDEFTTECSSDGELSCSASCGC